MVMGVMTQGKGLRGKGKEVGNYNRKGFGAKKKADMGNMSALGSACRSGYRARALWFGATVAVMLREEVFPDASVDVMLMVYTRPELLPVRSERTYTS